jgi:thymidylate kinase
MRIILEGPDNAGKTTLAQKLMTRAGVLYHHPGGRPNGYDGEMHCIEEQITMLDLNEHIILDRCTPISQQVYNPDPKWDEVRMDALSVMQKFEPVFIYCRPSDDKLLRVQDLTWREGETEEHMQKIIRGQHTFVQRYDVLMNKIPCISYDFEDEAHAKIIEDKAVKALMGSYADRQWFRSLINLRTK